MVFVKGIEIDLVLVWVSKLNFSSGVEIDFVVGFEPIIVRFSCMDRNRLGFSTEISIHLILLCLPAIAFFSVDID